MTGRQEARDRVLGLPTVRIREELGEVDVESRRELLPQAFDHGGRVDEGAIHVEEHGVDVDRPGPEGREGGHGLLRGVGGLDGSGAT